MRRVVLFRSVAALAILGLAAGAFAQTFQGSIRGLITDTDGGVLPGVSVTLENEGTGVTRTAVSNAVGEYVFANVQPSTYTVSAELSGFAPFVSEGLIVGVSAALVVDATLGVGGIEETVTVTGETPLIEAASASVASSVDRAQLEVLPTPGRNVFITSVGTPNVVHTGNPVWVKQSDQTNSSLLSIGGGPLRGNLYTIDGVATMDLRNRSVIIPIFEAVQEMKVQTNSYDAEMGRTSGGVFNVIHRTGTNNWAGSALYQFRPSKLNTFWRKLNYFQQKQYDSGDLLDEDINEAPYNLAGGSFGGPILRDRTFFWLSAEGYADDAIDNTTITVPTAAVAGGDFSDTGRTIYNPYDLDANGNRRPFPGNRIPADMIDPTGSAMARLLTTLGSGGDLSTSGTQRVQALQATSNLSHSFSDSWQFSGTYLYYTSEEPAFGHYGDLLNSEPPAFGIGAASLGRDVHAVAINNTFITGDASVMTLRVGYSYFNDSVANPEYTLDQARNELGIQGDFLDQIYAQEGYTGQFPSYDVANYGDSGSTFGSWSNNDIQWRSREVSGTYSQFVGNHTLKYGVQYRRLGLHATRFGNGFAIQFAQKFTQGPNPTAPDANSGDALADLLLGIPNGGTATLAQPADVFIDYFGGFVQDDWRPNSNLVLNLGLRLERETGLMEDDNGFAVGWDRENPFPIQVAAPAGLDGLSGFPLRGGLMYAGVDGNPTHQWDPPAIKFGPRVGFAYTVNPETVIRGGYAVFWAPYALPGGQAASSLGTLGYTTETNLTESIDGITPPEATASTPFPNGIDNPVGNGAGRLQNIGGVVYFNEQFRASPYLHKWSLDVQRDIGREIAVKVGYVGSRGADWPIGGTRDSSVNINQLPDSALALSTDQLNERVANPFYGDSRFGDLSKSETLPYAQLLRPYPHFTNVFARHVSAGKSLYNSLRVELEKRFRGNWGARVNYTFTRHDDNIYEDNTLTENETSFIYNTPDECAFSKCPVIDADYGPSRIHIPHQLNINATYRTPGDNPIFSGWALSVVAMMRSGFPLVITQNSNPLSAYGFSHQRPASIGISGGGNPSGNDENYLSEGGTTATEGLTLSSAPHTTDDVRSPALVNWDVSLEKSTNIFNDLDLTLRFEFIDAFNHVNWRGPRSVVGTGNFGSIPGTRGFPRTFQFMAKVTF